MDASAGQDGAMSRVVEPSVHRPPMARGVAKFPGESAQAFDIHYAG
jgi:hypothetical protein